MKMSYQEYEGGQVIVSVAGDTIAGVKTAHYCSCKYIIDGRPL